LEREREHTLLLAVGCASTTLILSFKEEKERITNYISGFVEDIWG